MKPIITKLMPACARRQWRIGLAMAIALLIVAANWLPLSQASNPTASIPVPVTDTCLTATVISPASLPFTEDATTIGAANDVDPSAGGCTAGPGPDVIYRFTPSVTDTYTIGVTPVSGLFDVSLYVVTDCSSVSTSCVVGANIGTIGKSEVVMPTLISGTAYFIIVDSPISGNSGDFHFALRRGTPANDACATAEVIDPSRLPFSAAGSTFGAADNLRPNACVASNRDVAGPEVVYSFTPSNSQTYRIRVTPEGNFNPVVYFFTNCTTFAGCRSANTSGGGEVEELLGSLQEGTTYFIGVDGRQDNSGQEIGDFTIEVIPTIPIPPDAPTNLMATAINGNRIDLTWADNADNELGFRIERSLDGQNFQTVGTVNPNVTAFSDTTVAANTTYFYRVFAFNNFGSSAASNVASATTPEPPPPPVPVIQVTPDMVDFGTVGTQPATRTVTVRNIGGATLTITAISDPAAPFSIVDKPTLPLMLATNQSVDLTVRFAPASAQTFTSAFTVTSNAPADAIFTVNLRGVGSVTPVPNLDFGSLLLNFTSGEGAIAIEVKNTGDADLLLANIQGPQSPFAASGAPPLPTIMEPGESFVLTVSFSPPASGIFIGVINFLSNDPDQTIGVLRLRGVSTPENEVLKLKAPAQISIVAGTSKTLNVLAANGTNANIQLSATSLQGATFTDRSSGRGDLVYNPGASASGRVSVTFTARDSANRMKSVLCLITILPAADTHNVQIVLTPPETASNPPTGVAANDLSITPLGFEPLAAPNLEPAVAAGLIGYAIYRSNNANVVESLANIVGIIPANQTTFTDTVPAPAGSTQLFFYSVTALYQTGIESGGSNETSTAPRIVGLQFRKKGLRFQAANANFAVGAVLILNGTQTFTLTRDGDLLVVDKNARSTPGNLRIRDIVRTGTTNNVQGHNPNGVVSNTVSITR